MNLCVQMTIEQVPVKFFTYAYLPMGSLIPWAHKSLRLQIPCSCFNGCENTQGTHLSACMSTCMCVCVKETRTKRSVLHVQGTCVPTHDA
jgi:hypothetical protein